jgi:hypothetical protein
LPPGGNGPGIHTSGTCSWPGRKMDRRLTAGRRVGRYSLSRVSVGEQMSGRRGGRMQNECSSRGCWLVCTDNQNALNWAIITADETIAKPPSSSVAGRIAPDTASHSTTPGENPGVTSPEGHRPRKVTTTDRKWLTTHQRAEARVTEGQVVHASLLSARVGPFCPLCFCPLCLCSGLTRPRHISKTSIFSFNPHAAEIMNRLTSMLVTPPGRTGRPFPRRTRWLRPCPPAAGCVSRWGLR